MIVILGCVWPWTFPSTCWSCTVGSDIAFLRSFTKLRKASTSFVMSVCPSAWNNSSPTERILITFAIRVSFEKSVEKIQVLLNPTWVTGTLHEDLFTFMTVSHYMFLRIRNFCTEIVEKIKTSTLLSVTFFRKSHLLWDNVKKIWWSQTGHRWRHYMSHTCCMLYKKG